MTFYPSTQAEMQRVINGLRDGDDSATKTAISILEQVCQAFPSNEEIHCSYCGTSDPTNVLEVEEGTYKYMEGRETLRQRS